MFLIFLKKGLIESLFIELKYEKIVKIVYFFNNLKEINVKLSYFYLFVFLQPALNPEDHKSNDYVLLNKWATRNYEIMHGDIIALT